ncbi:MAG TPA: hypothetical protein EYQ61_08585 [Dehalococcoidia bacterium]|nr:hypothetical protein [Dehalococcoidia bacterium]
MTANIIWLLAFVIITGLGVRYAIKLFRPFGGIRRSVGGVLLSLVSDYRALFDTGATGNIQSVETRSSKLMSRATKRRSPAAKRSPYGHALAATR